MLCSRILKVKYQRKSNIPTDIPISLKVSLRNKNHSPTYILLFHFHLFSIVFFCLGLKFRIRSEKVRIFGTDSCSFWSILACIMYKTPNPQSMTVHRWEFQRKYSKVLISFASQRSESSKFVFRKYEMNWIAYANSIHIFHSLLFSFFRIFSHFWLLFIFIMMKFLSCFYSHFPFYRRIRYALCTYPSQIIIIVKVWPWTRKTIKQK